MAYAWDFTGDGVPDQEGTKVTWTFLAEGEYAVTLTVADNGGLMATVTKQVGPYGEVTAINLARNLVTISLGARHGIRVGDRFKVILVVSLLDERWSF